MSQGDQQQPGGYDPQRGQDPQQPEGYATNRHWQHEQQQSPQSQPQYGEAGYGQQPAYGQPQPWQQQTSSQPLTPADPWQQTPPQPQPPSAADAWQQAPADPWQQQAQPAQWQTQPGSQQSSYQQPGYQTGYQDQGYQQAAHQQPGQQPGYLQTGYQQTGPAQPQAGVPQPQQAWQQSAQTPEQQWQQQGGQAGQTPQWQQTGQVAGQQQQWPQTGQIAGQQQQWPQTGQIAGQQQQWQQPGQAPQQPWQQAASGPTPPPKSRRGLWIGLAAGATVLVLLAGCGVVFALWQSKPDSVESLPTPTTSGRASRTATPSKKPPSAVTLVRPERIGTRNRITEGEYATKAAGAEEKLRSSLKPGGSLVVAYYGTTDRKADQIYIVGSTIPGPVRKTTFDSEFAKTGPAIDGKPVTGTVDIPPGTAGGYIKCGQTTQSGMDVALCAFTNEYDFVVVQWYNRQLNADIKKEIVTIRGLLEQ